MPGGGGKGGAVGERREKGGWQGKGSRKMEREDLGQLFASPIDDLKLSV